MADNSALTRVGVQNSGHPTEFGNSGHTDLKKLIRVGKVLKLMWIRSLYSIGLSSAKRKIVSHTFPFYPFYPSFMPNMTSMLQHVVC